MPILKIKKGFGPLCKVRDYLFGQGRSDGRALASDYLNVTPIDHRGRDWTEQMNEMREAFGNDADHGSKRARRYNHYILSPDPTDDITIEQLREYATSFVEENFAQFQCAIVYHDDNKERIARGEDGILHAHIIVNNTNVETGGRLTSYLRDEKVREISKNAQRLAHRLGLSAFSWEEGVEETKRSPRFQDVNEPRGTQKAAPRLWKTRQGGYYTKSERELLAQGHYSWKEDLRARINIAKRISHDMNDFKRALGLLGVECEMGAHGGYIYHHPDSEEHPRWLVKDMKLGYGYTRERIATFVERTDEKAAFVPTRIRDHHRALILSALKDDFHASYRGHLPQHADVKLDRIYETMRKVYGMRSIVSVGALSNDADMTLADVAEYLETTSRFNITDATSFNRELDGATTPEEHARITKAYEVHKALGERAKVPFQRMPSNTILRLDDSIAQTVLQRRYSKTAIAKMNERIEGQPDRYSKLAGSHNLTDRDQLAGSDLRAKEGKNATVKLEQRTNDIEERR